MMQRQQNRKAIRAVQCGTLQEGQRLPGQGSELLPLDQCVQADQANVTDPVVPVDRTRARESDRQRPHASARVRRGCRV